MLEKRRILVSTFLCSPTYTLDEHHTGTYNDCSLPPIPSQAQYGLTYINLTIFPISLLQCNDSLPTLKLDGGFFALIFSSLHSESQKFYVFIRIRSKKKTFLYLQHSPTQRIMVTGCWQALLLLTMPPAPIMYLFFHIVVPAKSLAKNEPLSCTCFGAHKTYCKEFIHDLS